MLRLRLRILSAQHATRSLPLVLVRYSDTGRRIDPRHVWAREIGCAGIMGIGRRREGRRREGRRICCTRVSLSWPLYSPEPCAGSTSLAITLPIATTRAPPRAAVQPQLSLTRRQGSAHKHTQLLFQRAQIPSLPSFGLLNLRRC